VFRMACGALGDGDEVAEGEGGSRRSAEQAAASAVLTQLGEQA
jgi:ribonuclease-3